MAAKKRPKMPTPMSCPFCGGAPTHRASKDGENWVACLECGALGPFTRAKRSATNSWNLREVMTTTG